MSKNNTTSQVFPDYYQLFGIDPGSSKGQIKDRYKELKSQYGIEGDKSEQSVEKVIEINQGFRVLGNQKLRPLYDQYYQKYRGLSGSVKYNEQIQNLTYEMNLALATKAVKEKIALGAVFLVIGLGVLIGGYLNASSNDGNYILPYGSIIWGGWQMIAGIRQYRNIRSGTRATE
ncbi:hypothetical protein KC853_00875 [Candidatus Saccharibacteria bacterium]|nr:hypothetical protein [Candidatus Saccharibacteria bacterium]MCB9834750.1 hypothetical protein [Candidatus Nomurabacteria bacterium]